MAAARAGLARRQPRRPLPEPSRRPRVHAGAVAGGRVPSGPRPRPHPDPSPGGPVALSFTFSSEPLEDRSTSTCSRCRSVPTRGLRSRCRRRRRRARRRARRLHGRGRLRGQARRDPRGADRSASSTAKARACSSASATPTSSRPTACAAPPPRSRERSTKVASVATTLVDLADGAGLDRAEAAQAVAEGFVLGVVPVPRVQGRRDAAKLLEDDRARGAGRRPPPGRGRPRRGDRRRGHVGARHGQRAVGREVAGRHSPTPPASCCAARVTVKVLDGRAARGAAHRRRARRRPGLGERRRAS